MRNRSVLVILLAAACVPLASLAQPADSAGSPVIGQVEHVGWGLSGPRGRHYLFGGVAMADYTDSVGQRRIVALHHQEELDDERYLYYRELRFGHRWAFAKRPAADGLYGVYFQLGAADSSEKPTWLPFHRARLEQAEDRAQTALRSAPVKALSPEFACCQ